MALRDARVAVLNVAARQKVTNLGAPQSFQSIRERICNGLQLFLGKRSQSTLHCVVLTVVAYRLQVVIRLVSSLDASSPSLHARRVL